MKVELHCHTSRYSACARATPAEMMERLARLDYEAVFLTEHDAVWSDWELDQLRAGHPRVRIFPGVELSVGCEHVLHLLVLGTTDRAYLEIRDAGEVLRRAREQGHLTVLAHPFRWPGAAEMLQAGLLPDALEYRTCNHDSRCARMAEEAARRYDLPLVNAGDAHGVDFLDRFWIETDRPLVRGDDVRDIILGGAYRNRVGEKERW